MKHTEEYLCYVWDRLDAGEEAAGWTHKAEDGEHGEDRLHCLEGDIYVRRSREGTGSGPGQWDEMKALARNLKT